VFRARLGQSLKHPISQGSCVFEHAVSPRRLCLSLRTLFQAGGVIRAVLRDALSIYTIKWQLCFSRLLCHSLLSSCACRTVKCPDLVYQPNEWRQHALEFLRGLPMKHPTVWNKFKRRPLYEFLEPTRAHTRLFLVVGMRHKTEVGVRVVMVWRQREGAYAWPPHHSRDGLAHARVAGGLPGRAHRVGAQLHQDLWAQVRTTKWLISF
jgi:hypothetical protein